MKKSLLGLVVILSVGFILSFSSPAFSESGLPRTAPSINTDMVPGSVIRTDPHHQRICQQYAGNPALRQCCRKDEDHSLTYEEILECRCDRDPRDPHCCALPSFASHPLCTRDSCEEVVKECASETYDERQACCEKNGVARGLDCNCCFNPHSEQCQ